MLSVHSPLPHGFAMMASGNGTSFRISTLLSLYSFAASSHLPMVHPPTLFQVAGYIWRVKLMDRDSYLHDMRICQRWAALNRKPISRLLLKFFSGTEVSEEFESVYNYISDDNLIRKGSISPAASSRWFTNLPERLSPTSATPSMCMTSSVPFSSSKPPNDYKRIPLIINH